MSHSPVEILGVGDRLREEIEHGPFNRFVIFTHGISEQYLDWFDPQDQVAICGPSETVRTVRDANTQPTLSEYNRKTHAKIYLLYNESRIVAYLGSFNFTRNGLYGGVEWGARYEGELTHSPTPKSLIDGEAPAELSSSPIIEQIATIVGASMTGNDTHAADSWVANTGLGEGVVHTLTSNTLQSAFTELLQDTEPPLEIKYYSPFVSYEGIEEFSSYLPDTLTASDIEFTVYTKRLSRMQADETKLSPAQITELNDKFGTFQFRARAPGEQGNHLGDGREIRDGMAHLKAITLTDYPDGDARSLGTILTSANLSWRAWSRKSAGFEIGVALEGTPDNERLHHLFTDLLPQAYTDPSDREIVTAGGTGTPQTRGTETWLDTQLRHNTTLKHDSVTVAWDDSFPTLDSLSGTLRIRDLSSGDRSEYDLDFTRIDDGFEAPFPSLNGQSNRIIDFVRLTADTRHSPPELEYTGHEIRELRAEEGIEGPEDPLPNEWANYDEIIWNGSRSTPVENASFQDVETIHSVQLRATSDTPETYYAIIEPDAQPHIDQLFHRITTAEEHVEPLGTLLKVRVETHPAIEPNPQHIAFYTDRDERINPIGFAPQTQANIQDYYISPEHAAKTLTVAIDGSLTHYITQTNGEITLPELESDTPVDLEPHFSTDQWRATPNDLNPVLSRNRYPNSPNNPFLAEKEPSPEDQISTEIPVTITPPDTLLEQVEHDQLAVWWRPSGVFRSGTTQPVSTPIPPQEMRTHVTYRGIVQLTGANGPVNIWLPGGSYIVKEQPFVDELTASLIGVPTEQPLGRLRSDTLLGWATIQQDTLLRPRASDVTECITPRLYVDTEPVRNEIFDVARDDGVLCIPILGQHLGETRTLTLRLWLSGGPAKTTIYTETAINFELSVTESANGLQVKLDHDTRQVTDSPAEPDVDLTQFIGEFDLNEFKQAAEHTAETFVIESYDPLYIHPKEMLLFYFTDN
ncbi:phospholipase D family protein [Halorubrum sp. SD626R]|uniref:phospholipase D family protein n=1 Tax=Halorubrum sp. SD626R TaxID=1419722 RepID=UPI000A537F4A|nr:phospholipase D family protein [Halorubrum sp. SD626R]